MPELGHDYYMQLALEQAAKGLGYTSPNPAVGCVIVRQGKVVGAGFHAKAGGPHAEVVALKNAGAKARGADVYVTLEPCDHVGRTGRCTDALLAAGVTRVFVGARDANPLVNGRGIKRLRAAGIAVEPDILGGACSSLNAPFATFITQQRSFVAAKIAQSLDGRVATRTGASQWITGKEARLAGHKLRSQYDAIMVGIGTVLADNPRLTARGVKGARDPLRVIVDSQARLPPSSNVLKVLSSSTSATLVVVGPQAPAKRVQALQRRGAEILVCDAPKGKVDLAQMLACLAARDIVSVLAEGGPTLMGGLFDAGLVDRLHAFVAPRILGGVEAVGSVGGTGVALPGDGWSLVHPQFTWLGRDFLLSGEIHRSGKN